VPLSRLEWPAKVFVQLRSRFVGLPRARRVRLFPCGRFGFLVELPSPEPASSRFILPWPSSSSEFLRSNLPPAAFAGGTPTQGLFPHRGITEVRPHFSRRLPSPRYVPSSGFRNLSTVSSALRLYRLVSSRSHVQGSSRSGASLPAQPSSLIESPCPLVVVVPSPRRQAQRPRFRGPPATGCQARGRLDFEALIHARSRCVRFGG
jgi:hypothetical protein